MRLFKKIGERSEPARDISDAERRVGLLPTNELIPWGEQSLYNIGSSLTNYTKTGEIEDLIEAQMAADTLDAILAEMIQRASR